MTIIVIVNCQQNHQH